MSILHMPYDDPRFMRQRDSATYEMGMALDMKPSSLLHDPYMFDQLLHPLAPMTSSHSMPYDVPHDFAPSHYHPINSVPYDLHNTGISADLDWTETAHRSYYQEPPATQSYPPTSISQPSMFVSSPSSRPIAPSETMPSVDRSALPPPPWTMSGSLDPSTGVYQVAPEHPRIRTAQACEKCRGRKAKCSGEHPSCERCRLRGLKCEYAPERKMRGPNKVKRKTGDKSSRRISVASTISEASTESSTSESSSTRPVTPPNTEFQQFTLDLGNPNAVSRPSTACSRHSSSSESSPNLAHAQSVEGRSDRPRPSHIDLSGTKLSDQMQLSYIGANDTFAYDISDARRASLPANLVDSFTPHHHGHIRSPSLRNLYTPSREIDVIDTNASRPRSNPTHHHHHHNTHHPFTMSSTHGEASSGSESDISMSAPVTPVTMPLSNQLIFPVPMDFQTEFMDLVTLDPPLDASESDRSWDNVGVADVDVTPRVTSDGHEKSLAQFEHHYYESLPLSS
ncbi:hypothetical protein BDY19DRAFT_992757 [Irpex rosettiformis]|uniref:Uncharacterized protein n=1 Tax=Irpex rosettiformis TaxID=378272 RepID=A0ACB8U6E4_9APHY|nr:hypothetical protein BDY19DRAFT_992757 [Irpex rosettiformis]